MEKCPSCGANLSGALDRIIAGAYEAAATMLYQEYKKLREEMPPEVAGVAWDVVEKWVQAIRMLDSTGFTDLLIAGAYLAACEAVRKVIPKIELLVTSEPTIEELESILHSESELLEDVRINPDGTIGFERPDILEDCLVAIRSLTPADAQAALDRCIDDAVDDAREADAKLWRERLDRKVNEARLEEAEWWGAKLEGHEVEYHIAIELSKRIAELKAVLEKP